jgi:opacity protein-like surface antigen
MTLQIIGSIHTSRKRRFNMKTYLIAIATLVTFSIPSLSQAAGRPGPYFSGFLGTSFATDTTVSSFDNSTPFGTTFSDRVSFDPGVYVGGTGGYDFGFLRLEGELSYRHAGIDTVTDVNGSRFRNVDGDVGVFATMFNAYFDMQNPSRVTPYLGGGIGFATVHISDTTGFNNSGKVFLYDRSSDTVFAYQVGAGMDIALTNRYSLDVGYRYFKTEKATLDGDFITSELRFESHNAMVGFKFKF